MIHWIYIVSFIGLYFASVRFLRVYLGLKERKDVLMDIISFTPVLNTAIILFGFLWILWIVIREAAIYTINNLKNKG